MWLRSGGEHCGGEDFDPELAVRVRREEHCDLDLDGGDHCDPEVVVRVWGKRCGPALAVEVRRRRRQRRDS